MTEIRVEVSVEDVIESIRDSWGLDKNTQIDSNTPLGKIDGKIRELAYMLGLLDRLGLRDYVGKDEDRLLPEVKEALFNMGLSKSFYGCPLGEYHFKKLSKSSTLDFCNAVTPQDLVDILNYQATA